MVKLSGGGISGAKTVQSRAGGKVEPKAKAISPGAVNQMGVSTQFIKEKLESGKGYEPKAQGATGIGKATTRPDTPGPGSGRTTYASGSQGACPEATPLPTGRKVF